MEIKTTCYLVMNVLKKKSIKKAKFWTKIKMKTWHNKTTEAHWMDCYKGDLNCPQGGKSTDLMMQLKSLKKEEHTKSRHSQCQEVIKIWAKNQ